MKNKAILMFLMCFFLLGIAYADKCLDWFNESGVNSTDKECISKCNLYPKDMGTFSCSNECEKFCSLKKCKIEDHWKAKVKLGRPGSWGVEHEKSTPWSQDEQDQILMILTSLPEDLKRVSLDGIYRMKKSVNLINPGSTAEDGKSIVLYDRAFNNPNWSAKDVILHEYGHVVYMSYSKVEQDDYKKHLGWQKDQVRPGGFVTTRAKDDPIEDFAENFKYLLLYPDQLEKINKKALKWFKAKYKKHLVLKKECL